MSNRRYAETADVYAADAIEKALSAALAALIGARAALNVADLSTRLEQDICLTLTIRAVEAAKDARDTAAQMALGLRLERDQYNPETPGAYDTRGESFYVETRAEYED